MKKFETLAAGRAEDGKPYSYTINESRIGGWLYDVFSRKTTVW